MIAAFSPDFFFIMAAKSGDDVSAVESGVAACSVAAVAPVNANDKARCDGFMEILLRQAAKGPRRSQRAVAPAIAPIHRLHRSDRLLLSAANDQVARRDLPDCQIARADRLAAPGHWRNSRPS